MFDASNRPKINNCIAYRIFGFQYTKVFNRLHYHFLMQLNFYDVDDQNSLKVTKKWIDIVAFNSKNKIVVKERINIKFSPLLDACSSNPIQAKQMRVKFTFGMKNSSGTLNLLSDPKFAMGRVLYNPAKPDHASGDDRDRS